MYELEFVFRLAINAYYNLKGEQFIFRLKVQKTQTQTQAGKFWPLLHILIRQIQLVHGFNSSGLYDNTY